MGTREEGDNSVTAPSDDKSHELESTGQGIAKVDRLVSKKLRLGVFEQLNKPSGRKDCCIDISVARRPIAFAEEEAARDSTLSLNKEAQDHIILGSSLSAFSFSLDATMEKKETMQSLPHASVQLSSSPKRSKQTSQVKPPFSFALNLAQNDVPVAQNPTPIEQFSFKLDTTVSRETAEKSSVPTSSGCSLLTSSAEHRLEGPINSSVCPSLCARSPIHCMQLEAGNKQERLDSQHLLVVSGDSHTDDIISLFAPDETLGIVPNSPPLHHQKLSASLSLPDTLGLVSNAVTVASDHHCVSAPIPQFTNPISFSASRFVELAQNSPLPDSCSSSLLASSDSVSQTDLSYAPPTMPCFTDMHGTNLSSAQVLTGDMAGLQQVQVKQCVVQQHKEAPHFRASHVELGKGTCPPHWSHMRHPAHQKTTRLALLI